MYCVYLTVYRGNGLPKKTKNSLAAPRLYIGSSKLEKVVDKNYRGSVASKKYSKLWMAELKQHPELFKTRILSLHTDDTLAKEEEKRLQVKYNVVQNDKFINMSFASPNGFFGKPNEGIVFSEETRAKMSVHRKGRTYEEIFGEEKAQELKEKRRQQKIWNKGQKMPEEMVSKAKEGLKGLFFITDGVKDAKVKTEEEIPNGWRRGRTNGVAHCPSGWNKGLPGWNQHKPKL